MERVRCGWLLVLGAIVGSTLAAAEPAPPAPTVPLLVIGAPSTFELARLASALDTYVPNAKLAVTSASADAGCEEALADARAAQSPIGLWLQWTPDGAIVIERVDAAGCAAIESSTVEVPPEQPSFVYRVIALKVASLVRELPVPPPTAPAPVPPKVIATAPPSAPIAPRSPWRAIDVGASGIADTAAESRGYFASAGAWFGRTWLLGGDVRVGLAHDATRSGRPGRARGRSARSPVFATRSPFGPGGRSMRRSSSARSACTVRRRARTWRARIPQMCGRQRWRSHLGSGSPWSGRARSRWDPHSSSWPARSSSTWEFRRFTPRVASGCAATSRPRSRFSRSGARAYYNLVLAPDLL